MCEWKNPTTAKVIIVSLAMLLSIETAFLLKTLLEQRDVKNCNGVGIGNISAEEEGGDGSSSSLSDSYRGSEINGDRQRKTKDDGSLDTSLEDLAKHASTLTPEEHQQYVYSFDSERPVPREFRRQDLLNGTERRTDELSYPRYTILHRCKRFGNFTALQCEPVEQEDVDIAFIVTRYTLSGNESRIEKLTVTNDTKCYCKVL